MTQCNHGGRHDPCVVSWRSEKQEVTQKTTMYHIQAFRLTQVTQEATTTVTCFLLSLLIFSFSLTFFTASLLISWYLSFIFSYLPSLLSFFVSFFPILSLFVSSLPILLSLFVYFLLLTSFLAFFPYLFYSFLSILPYSFLSVLFFFSNMFSTVFISYFHIHLSYPFLNSHSAEIQNYCLLQNEYFYFGSSFTFT